MQEITEEDVRTALKQAGIGCPDCIVTTVAYRANRWKMDDIVAVYHHVQNQLNKQSDSDDEDSYGESISDYDTHLGGDSPEERAIHIQFR